VLTDEEEESSSAEEVEEDGPSEIKLRLQDKPSTDKDSSTKESEAGAEISALVNYVQPVHFFSFEISKSKYLAIDS
jgi:phosphatidylinositol phospholipase C beta